jgi:hypothetical protein
LIYNDSQNAKILVSTRAAHENGQVIEKPTIADSELMKLVSGSNKSQQLSLLLQGIPGHGTSSANPCRG